MNLPQPIVFAPNLYVNGCVCAYATNATWTVGVGELRDSTNTYDIPVTSELTVNTAVSGANGLDTGTIAASTMYALYVIFDPTNNVPTACLLSASFTSPVMPSTRGTTYGAYRLVDFLLTDGSSHLLPAYNCGTGSARYKQYDAPISVQTTGAATSYTAIDLSVAVPNVQFGRVKFRAGYTPHAAAETASLTPTGGTGNAYVTSGIVASVLQNETVDLLPLVAASKAEISYKVSVTTSPANLAVSVVGYEYFL